jgi:hypothetical protein
MEHNKEYYEKLPDEDKTQCKVFGVCKGNKCEVDLCMKQSCPNGICDCQNKHCRDIGVLMSQYQARERKGELTDYRNTPCKVDKCEIKCFHNPKLFENRQCFKGNSPRYICADKECQDVDCPYLL